MINGKYHKTATKYGERILVDLADIGGEYEVMAMSLDDGDELDVFRTPDFEIAERVYREMEQRFTQPDLTGKYKQLYLDLLDAFTAGQNAMLENPEDGGTCNFDAPTLTLPRWNTAKVKQAAQEAGLGIFEHKIFGAREYVITPEVCAQGNARTRYAEAMRDSLAAAGYDAGMYYQMD